MAKEWKGNKHVAALLKDNGFVLVRESKHSIFRHPSGAQLSVSKSPRCDKTQERKIRSEIRRINEQVQLGA
jgi:predicted RNA binding protein YcfA (HicA-like mRNA interferase family)